MIDLLSIEYGSSLVCTEDVIHEDVLVFSKGNLYPRIRNEDSPKKELFVLDNFTDVFLIYRKDHAWNYSSYFKPATDKDRFLAFFESLGLYSVPFKSTDQITDIVYVLGAEFKFDESGSVILPKKE